jgi:NAD dependent epimerase/dehydratase family enzyme
VIAGLRHLLQSEAISGAVNLVAPGTVTNREFTQTLAQVLSRPAPFIVPAPALYLAYGRQMPRETLLASSRVVPDRLVRSGYQFRFPELRQALMHVLEKPAKKV